MKILFDTQIFDWQINGGISRYFIELINRLEKYPEVQVEFEIKHSYNTYLQGTQWLKYEPWFKNFNFKGKLRVLKEINQVINRRFSSSVLKSQALDIFHLTYYDPYFLKYIGDKPFVLTVYDLTNEKFPDGSQLTKTVLAWKKTLIERAAHIISISENTKSDIVDYYKISPEKITTVYLSGGLEESATSEPPMAVAEEKYILFVGSRSGYKNFAAFCKEVSSLLIRHDIKLFVAGGGAFNSGETALLQALNIYERTRLFANVSDGNLAQLYRKAVVFIFPSLYEGFGIPVLEAMKCECPVLLSNNSSLPEVGGQAAAYFNPLVEGDLHKALNELMSNDAKLAEMKRLGVQQLLNFSWDITARKHLEVYKKVLADK